MSVTFLPVNMMAMMKWESLWGRLVQLAQQAEARLIRLAGDSAPDSLPDSRLMENKPHHRGGQITKRSVDASAQTTQLSCLLSALSFFSPQAEHDLQLSVSSDIRGMAVRPFSPQVTETGKMTAGIIIFTDGLLINLIHSDFFFFFLPFITCRLLRAVLPAPLLSLPPSEW